MNLLLHIGSPKTGTTTLQHALSDNRQNLLDRGILYPEIDGKFNHNIISLIFRNNPPVREYARLHGGNPNRLAEEGWKALEYIKKQCADTNASTLLISSEYLFFPLNSAESSKFSSSLLSHFDRIKTVCYLKHPIDYFGSVAAQQFKAATRISGSKPSPYLDILRGYKSFTDVVVREFSQHSLVNGDILSDFSDTVLKLHDFELTGKRRNEGASAEGLLLLSRYRSLEMPNKENTFTSASRKLLNIIQNAERKAKLQSKPVVRANLANQLWQAFLPSCPALQEEFGLTYTSPLEEHVDPQTPPMHQLSVSDVFEIDDLRYSELAVHVVRELMDHLQRATAVAN